MERINHPPQNPEDNSAKEEVCVPEAWFDERKRDAQAASYLKSKLDERNRWQAADDAATWGE